MADAPDRIVSGIQMGLRLLVALAVSLVVVPPVAAGVTVLTLFKAPLPGELPDQRPNMVAVPSRVLDAAGNEIGQFRGFDRTVEVRPSEVPDAVKNAVVAIEDRRFWEHDGVDFEGVARAARVNLELGEVAQGGSTITQQYIKNVYLSGERTFERKFREALLATELEAQLSKEEILFNYLETVYFGSGAYGIGAAAEVYFGKPASELDVSEAATLAGVIQSPTKLSPRVDIEGAEARRKLVLQAMLDEGYLTPAEYERHAGRQLWLVTDGDRPIGGVTLLTPPPLKGASDHPFFVDWVEGQLLDLVGPDLLYQGGLTIETTIDPRLQEAAEEAVAARLANTEHPVEMSLVSLDPRSGEVKAMVGGRDYATSQVNLATGGSTGFQPGSSFKPIVLAEAFRRGIGPETVYPAPATWSVPGCSGDECVLSNYDNVSRGDITVRDAMRASVNTVFAQLITDVSVESTIELAQRLGFSRFEDDGVYGASVALGAVETSPLEMASAYGTFANRGVRIAPIGILRVIDPDGNVLIDNGAVSGDRVLAEPVADNVTDVLRGVVVDGTGQRAAVGGYPIAGKTGTAQAYRAAWFVGFTPSVATAVWMGHADRLDSLYGVNGVGRVTGGSHPAVAFSAYMQVALAGTTAEEFPVPVELEDSFESSSEVVSRRQEITVIGAQGVPDVLAPDCSGPCRPTEIAPPVLAPPPVTSPPTTGSPTSGPLGSPSTTTSPTSSSASTTTVVSNTTKPGADE
ncbi:MAG: penicillin-binding protein 1A [Acidimicrobiales bacterium]|jgi:1A family penicillin-binding protein